MTEAKTMVRPILYKREDAATRLGVSLRTLDGLLASKQLQSIRVGKKRRLISEEAIQSFIRKAERSGR